MTGVLAGPTPFYVFGLVWPRYCDVAALSSQPADYTAESRDSGLCRPGEIIIYILHHTIGQSRHFNLRKANFPS